MFIGVLRLGRAGHAAQSGMVSSAAAVPFTLALLGRGVAADGRAARGARALGGAATAACHCRATCSTRSGARGIFGRVAMSPWLRWCRPRSQPPGSAARAPSPGCSSPTWRRHAAGLAIGRGAPCRSISSARARPPLWPGRRGGGAAGRLPAPPQGTTAAGRTRPRRAGRRRRGVRDLRTLLAVSVFAPGPVSGAVQDAARSSAGSCAERAARRWSVRPRSGVPRAPRRRARRWGRSRRARDRGLAVGLIAGGRLLAPCRSRPPWPRLVLLVLITAIVPYDVQSTVAFGGGRREPRAPAVGRAADRRAAPRGPRLARHTAGTALTLGAGGRDRFLSPSRPFRRSTGCRGLRRRDDGQRAARADRLRRGRHRGAAAGRPHGAQALLKGLLGVGLASASGASCSGRSTSRSRRRRTPASARACASRPRGAARSRARSSRSPWRRHGVAALLSREIRSGSGARPARAAWWGSAPSTSC